MGKGTEAWIMSNQVEEGKHQRSVGVLCIGRIYVAGGIGAVCTHWEGERDCSTVVDIDMRSTTKKLLQKPTMR